MTIETLPTPAGHTPPQARPAADGGSSACSPEERSPALARVGPVERVGSKTDGGRYAGRKRGAASVLGSQAVVVHSGARDAYQVALALAERGSLACLVTDLWLPLDRWWARSLARLAPGRLRAQLLQRSPAALHPGASGEAGLQASRVRTLALRGLATLAVDKLPRLPFAWRRGLMRQTDAALGVAARRQARRAGATVLSYSYYGYHALGDAGSPGMLFQLHPHPASMRRILSAELAAHPECAGSLAQEWELALPAEDYERLVREPQMAAHILAASSFTRQTLVENGVPQERITVIPYGVDGERFSPAPLPRACSDDGLAARPLRLLFVGRINQRKGILYLLEALHLLNGSGLGAERVQLTVCGRVVDDLSLFAPFAGQVTIRPDVSEPELVEAYRAADLFVFPSVAEGFGQVLLESLACGLPILATTNTAAPDLIEQGVEGWVVPPARADLLAERIAWAAAHPEALARMRVAARARAGQFTWARFRQGVGDAFAAFASGQDRNQDPSDRNHGGPSHV